MQKLKKIVRLILLCLVAAAGLNGLMVFIFFDGTNFLAYQSYQWKKEAEEHRDALRDNRIKYLENRIESVRRSEKDMYLNREKRLNEKYKLLDTVIHASHLIHRYPVSGKHIGSKLSPVHPFKVENRVLRICAGESCFYEESLPRYVDVRFFQDKSALQTARLGARLNYNHNGTFPLEFSLAKKSGAFELWEAYWKTGDSLYEYHANYLVNMAGKRLLRRDVNIHREGVFMGEASPSGRYLYMDHGCCPGVRGISVVTEYGQTILDTSYMDGAGASWKNDTLVFFSPMEGKADGADPCSQHGMPAYSARKFHFIAGRIIRTDQKKVFCGQ